MNEVHPPYKQKLLSFAKLDQVLEKSIYIHSEKDKHKRNDVVAVHKFFSTVRIGKENFDVLIFVFETQKTYIYDHVLLKRKTGGVVGTLGAITHTQPLILRFTGYSYPKGNEYKIINNSEKIDNEITPVNNRLSGVVSASDISKLSFKKLELDGSYKKEFGELFSDTQIMIWGAPGNGKTVWLLNFAQYLAEKLNQRVLYIANEEWNRSTLTEKIIQFKIGHENLKVTKDLDSLKQAGLSIDDFDVVFFDSINSLGMDLKSYKTFVEANPGKVYVLIVQSTKDGDFRGGKDWEHEVDVAGEIHQRKLELRKNRLDKDFLKKLNEKAQVAQKVKTDLKAQKKGEKTNV